MRVDPAIRALRGDGAAQRQAQHRLESAAAEWRARPEVAATLSEFEDYGRGAPLGSSLAEVLRDLTAARRFADSLVRAMDEALADQPLGHIPFRHQLAEGMAVLQLACAGRATLSLVHYQLCGDTGAPNSICFTDGERREICLAGRAVTRRVIRDDVAKDKARLKFLYSTITPGSLLSFAGRDETKIVDRIDAPMTLLRLSRQTEAPLPSLEYRLDDGALLHRAAGDCRESRSELVFALLGRMERRDAVPAMLTLARSGSDSLRWQALRECLALDSAAGFRALTGIARDAADPLHAPAATLHADLRARHPQFTQLEREPCLA